jgi:hypothetical protein
MESLYVCHSVIKQISWVKPKPSAVRICREADGDTSEISHTNRLYDIGENLDAKQSGICRSAFFALPSVIVTTKLAKGGTR